MLVVKVSKLNSWEKGESILLLLSQFTVSILAPFNTDALPYTFIYYIYVLEKVLGILWQTCDIV